MSEYQFVDAKAVVNLVPGHFNEDEDLTEDYNCYLIKTNPDGTSEVLCRDGGEPEDMIFGRDLSPVCDVIDELQTERDDLAAKLAACSGPQVDTPEPQR